MRQAIDYPADFDVPYNENWIELLSPLLPMKNPVHFVECTGFQSMSVPGFGLRPASAAILFRAR